MKILEVNSNNSFIGYLMINGMKKFYSYLIFLLFIIIIIISSSSFRSSQGGEDTEKCNKMRKAGKMLALKLLKSKKCKVIFRKGYGKRKICRFEAEGTIVQYDFSTEKKPLKEPMSFTIEKLNPKMEIGIHSFDGQFSIVFIYWKNRMETGCIHDSARVYLDNVSWGTKWYSMKYSDLLNK